MQANRSLTKRMLHLKKTKPFKTCKKSKEGQFHFGKVVGVMISLVMIVILMPVILLSELDAMLDNMCMGSKKEVYN